MSFVRKASSPARRAALSLLLSLPPAGLSAGLVLRPDVARAQGPKSGKKRKKPERKWIKHQIIAGDSLDEIAERYGVTKSGLIRWNKLDPKRPMIIAGHKLSVYAAKFPPPREEISYEVKRGDTWYEIAKAHGCTVDELKRWNKKVPRAFKAGTDLTIWVEPEPPSYVEPGEKAVVDDTPLPLKQVRANGISVGSPNRGRLLHGIQMPENEALYTVLRPENCYGSSHTISTLQLAAARWRRVYDYSGALVISAISRPGGGRFRPHRSHQNGRDVDIRLPVRADVSGTSASSTGEVDWDATWAFVAELLATDQVVYIFLERSRQRYLYKAAQRAGVSEEDLRKFIQYPRQSGTNYGIVRHSRGHTAHMHVRFKCGPKDRSCADGT